MNVKYLTAMIIFCNSLFEITAFRSSLTSASLHKRFNLLSSTTDDESSTKPSTDIFGAEFRDKKVIIENEQIYWKGKAYIKRTITKEKSSKTKDEYDKLRITFLLDSIFISLLGFCAMWTFGSYKDSISYGIGAILGVGYALLLGIYSQMFPFIINSLFIGLL